MTNPLVGFAASEIKGTIYKMVFLLFMAQLRMFISLQALPVQ